ncbi:sensor domain-containing diguanylate cyclase [Chitinibacteraceae bacterium HSL-7]
MKTPDFPPDEDERLATLRGLHILDTLPEERFDRLTRMAKRVFDVPIALVSLIDANRQWFKSCQGLDATETPRDISFCGHAILDDRLFVIPDALSDIRFADNPLVTGPPYIRFYAGAPLVSYNGRKLGTLCVIDQRPRYLDDGDRNTLRDLAYMVERELAAVQLATLDALTGLSNRRGFLMLAQYCLEVCNRHRMPAVLVLADLDGFRAINDQYGHQAGDDALRLFGATLLDTCRDSDVFARVGADEFGILLSNTHTAGAHEHLERLRRALDESPSIRAQPFRLGASFSVIEYDPARHASIDTLMQACDAQRAG